ncbi:hypothetical protein SAMN04487934_102266 [Eubacterium ruminantium]|nr:hypothetical protein SAMN04487934_102266 [Eubacterium ruminantium]
MIKRKVLIISLGAIVLAAGLSGCKKDDNKTDDNKTDSITDNKTDNITGDVTGNITEGTVTGSSDESIKGILESPEDIGLTKESEEDGKETYSFTYANVKFNAIYTEENWKITDSYRIGNTRDMEIICQALINEHPIHGKDMVSCRTPEDMAYEWEQHNIVYLFLPESSKWKKNVKDVDLDPADQGRNLEELYEARTGKKFDFADLPDTLSK